MNVGRKFKINAIVSVVVAIGCVGLAAYDKRKKRKLAEQQQGELENFIY